MSRYHVNYHKYRVNIMLTYLVSHCYCSLICYMIEASSFNDNKRNVVLLSTFLFGSIKYIYTEPRALTHLPKVTITANACVLDLAACVMLWGEKNRSYRSERIIR